VFFHPDRRALFSLTSISPAQRSGGDPAGQPAGGELGFPAVVTPRFATRLLLDFFEIAFIVVPLLRPRRHGPRASTSSVRASLGINMQTSFMQRRSASPLFYLPLGCGEGAAYIEASAASAIEPVTTAA